MTTSRENWISSNPTFSGFPSWHLRKETGLRTTLHRFYVFCIMTTSSAWISNSPKSFSLVFPCDSFEWNSLSKNTSSLIPTSSEVGLEQYYITSFVFLHYDSFKWKFDSEQHYITVMLVSRSWQSRVKTWLRTTPQQMFAISCCQFRKKAGSNNTTSLFIVPLC